MKGCVCLAVANRFGTLGVLITVAVLILALLHFWDSKRQRSRKKIEPSARRSALGQQLPLYRRPSERPSALVETAGSRARSACPSGCTRRGNCNELTGVCECPFTHSGVNCDVPRMPACTLSDNETINLSFLVSEDAWDMLRHSGARSSPAVLWLGIVPCQCVLQAIEALSLHSSPMAHTWPAYIAVPFLFMQRVPCVDTTANLGTLWEYGPAAVASGAESHATPLPWAYVPTFAFIKQFPAHAPMLLPPGLMDESTYIQYTFTQPFVPAMDGQSVPRRAFFLNLSALGTRPVPQRIRLNRLVPKLPTTTIDWPQLVPSRLCGAHRCDGVGWCHHALPSGVTAVGKAHCRCAAGMMGSEALAELIAPSAPEVSSGGCSSLPADRFGPDRWRVSASSGRPSAIRACPNKCSGRGRGLCAYGFCHCEAGHWGIDCSYTKPPTSAVPATRASPRIHVYSLPPSLRRSCNWWRLSEDLGERLLRSEFSEPDPSRADLFWVYGCPNGDTILPAIEWVRQSHPWWNAAVRDGVARHVLVASHEEGWAEVWRYLEHWLRGPNGDHANLRHRWDTLHPASPTRQVAVVQLTGRSDYVAEGKRRPTLGVSAHAPCNICFQPGKDVVVPAHPDLVDYPKPGDCKRFEQLRAYAPGARGRALARAGSPEVLFAGAVWTRPEVYEPSRVVPYLCHKNASVCSGRDYLLVQSETAPASVHPWELDRRVDALAKARDAQFCLAPEGKAGGYGHRAIAYLLLGCVPVFTTERYSHRFFDEQINWSNIALHVPPADMPRLPAILATADTVAMRTAAEGVRRRLLWASVYGACHLSAHEGGDADAFDTLMEVLARPRRHFALTDAHRAPRAPEARRDLAAWLRGRESGHHCVHPCGKKAMSTATATDAPAIDAPIGAHAVQVPATADAPPSDVALAAHRGMLLNASAARHAYADAHNPGSIATNAPSQAALDACTVESAPILKLLFGHCAAGMHGFACDVRWDVQDSFLPRPRRWQRQWNASRAAAVDCQRGFFDAYAALLTRMHWENEWDAQPFRIAPTPPRTMGKMVHQLVTANYYHYTLGPNKQPPLRRIPAPGSQFRPMPQPGFRWNVLDYGGGMRQEIDYKRLQTMAGNVFSRPLSTGKRCAGVRAAWHCLWQRFPSQDLARYPAEGSPLGQAAEALYNLSLAGQRPDDLVQYLAAAGVMEVFTQVTPQVRAYLDENLRVLCHRGGPYCGGMRDEQQSPVAAVHVRHGDSCDRRRDSPGPFNAMFEWDKVKGRYERVNFRYCYDWVVYRAALLQLQKLYGTRTVAIATDDPTSEVLSNLWRERDFNWLYLDYPRGQFRKRAWMEFRSDLDEHAPFSLAAELELLSRAHMFVGNMGSHTSRTMYMRMLGGTKTAVLPPFISVDGYGLCCGFTDECSKAQIRKRGRSIRECIYSYGLVTGGEQWLYHRG